GEKTPADSAPAKLKSAASDKPAMSTAPVKAAVTASFNISPLKTLTITAVETRPAQYPYALQLACYSSEAGAREKYRAFKNAGLAPYIVKNVSRGKGETLWVIYTGYYETAEKADRDKQRYQLPDAIAARTPYAVLIGTFAAAEEMSVTVRHLEQLGYSPYAIPDGPGTLSLLTGAFATRPDAEQLRLQLQDDGIRSRLLLR
ncbi:MAG: SPOR domain-containing protein, partial [Proteobacteria bacterium]|nr:SPOR domain-containing protein [Pseudomonadota bacterium]